MTRSAPWWIAAVLAAFVSGPEGAAQEPPGPRKAEPEASDAPEKGAGYRAPEGYFASIEVGDFAAITAAFRDTRVGKFIRDERVRPVIDKMIERFQKKTKDIEAMRELARELSEGEFEGNVISRIGEELDKLEGLSGITVRGMRLSIYPYEAQEDEISAIASLAFDPKDEKVLREAAKIVDRLLLERKEVREGETRELDGHEVRFLEGRRGREKEADDEDEDAETEVGGEFDDLWYFFHENELHVGLDAAELLPRLTKTPSEPPGALLDAGTNVLHVELDLAAIAEKAMEDADTEDREKGRRILRHLGLASARRAHVAVAIDGSDFRLTYLVELPEPPADGLLAALVPTEPPERSAASAPRFPPLGDRLVELRGVLDPPRLLASIRALRKEAEDGDDAEDGEEGFLAKTGVSAEEIPAAFTGEYAFLLVGPPPLVPIPRFALALKTDEEKFSKLESTIQQNLEGIVFDEVDHEGRTITSIMIPNNPSPIVPTYTVVDGVLYIGDTPRTVKEIIDARKKPEASDGDGLVLPKGFRAPAVELTYDSGEIFRVMYERFLPMIQLWVGSAFSDPLAGEPLLSPGELPPAKTFVDYLAAGRGGAAWGPEGLYWTSVSALGDVSVELTASSYVGILPQFIGLALDSQRAQLEQNVCFYRLQKIGNALKLYRTAFGGGERYPRSIGELLSRGLIEDKSYFVVPSDDDPAQVEYETEEGEIRMLELSYRYLPSSQLEIPQNKMMFHRFEPQEEEGFDFSPFGSLSFRGRFRVEEGEKKQTIILYELDENRHGGRFLYAEDGTIYHVPEERFQELVSLK